MAETAQRVMEHGGRSVGELTTSEVPGAGRLTFQYLADPEGNLIEIQRWEKAGQPPSES